MRTIKKTDIGKKLTLLIDEKHPLDKDIGILDENDAIVGVFISKNAYDFFIKKIEEEEDRIDTESVKEFHDSGEKDL